ncbi:cobalamin biosynthesis protein CbiB [Acetobacter aceti NRIC 0242]|nr:cobalamin biosynthesis protein CbiB [Acetobacter aceti NRIC 0242]
MASCCLAQRSLHEHVEAVAQALENKGLSAGRQAVSMIVGRDTSALDEAAICRATIETLAENFSDGIVAPAFWCALGGLPGTVFYKAVNTADSMIGHRNERYEAFGKTAARLDDLINLPASRLSAFWIVSAAFFTGQDWKAALHTIRRDARHHRSPNAGWPEAAMAGALGLSIGGPRLYNGEVANVPWIGKGRQEATPADIRRALKLYRAACTIQCLTFYIIFRNTHNSRTQNANPIRN